MSATRQITEQQTLRSLVKETLAELLLLLRQRASRAPPQRNDVIAAVAGRIMYGIVAALVIYTGAMFLLWACVAATYTALVSTGVSNGVSICVAFLAMGSVWTIVGAVALWSILRSIHNAPVERLPEDGGGMV